MKVDLRVVTLEVPAQEAITRDNVTVKVNAVVYFRVVDPENAAVTGARLRPRHLADRPDHAAQRARPVRTRRAAVAARARSTSELQQIIDEQTEPWGIKVSTVEVQGRRAAADRCSARWPARPRPSARSGPRSSTPRASSKPPRSWPTRHEVIGGEPARYPVALSADADRDRRREELDDHLPGADRVVEPDTHNNGRLS